jgi:ATP-dependent helicase/DNAse subunit B
MKYAFTKDEFAKVEQLRDLAQELAPVLQSRFDELDEKYRAASERWQDSDRGEAATIWLDTFEEFLEAVNRLAETQMPKEP